MSFVGYFEIPVTDLTRAIAFYTAVFGFEFERTTMDGYEMALFPNMDGSNGPNGALACGDVYVPSVQGTIIYFFVKSIDESMNRVIGNGGTEIYPKTSIGEYGFVAEFQDSEGNRIGLSERI